MTIDTDLVRMVDLNMRMAGIGMIRNVSIIWSWIFGLLSSFSMTVLMSNKLNIIFKVIMNAMLNWRWWWFWFIKAQLSWCRLAFSWLLTVYLEADSLWDWVSNLHRIIMMTIFTRIKIFSWGFWPLFDGLWPCWLPCRCSLRGPEGRPSKGPGSRCATPLNEQKGNNNDCDQPPLAS